jgi:hypothetical protein
MILYSENLSVQYFLCSNFIARKTSEQFVFIFVRTAAYILSKHNPKNKTEEYFMDFRLNRENLTCSDVILNADVTQTAEHDFILPDYCPDIFRVLKCCVVPGIISTGINGSRMTFDLSVLIRVIYRSDDGAGIHCIEQTLDFSKTVDLPADAVNPAVEVKPSVEYVNCRVVNQRRLDVKGSVICHVKVVGEKNCEVVSDAFGCGIQLRKAPIVFPAKRLTAAKRITVIEELELAAGKPPFGVLLRCGTEINKGEQKIVSGKLITRGEVKISILYLPKDSDSKSPECMKFSIPFSQIIDVDGIDEGFEPTVDITAAKCTVIPKTDESGVLECELVMLVNITATKYDTCELVTDAYSTIYECECETLALTPQSAPQKINTAATVQSEISCSDGEIEKIYDLWCEQPSVSYRYDEQRKAVVLYGKITFCMLARLKEGFSAYAEKECAFETLYETGDEDSSQLELQPEINVSGCSYGMTENGAEVTAELLIGGTRSKKLGIPLLSSINVLTDSPKECDKKCAVKICYTKTDENLWDIAKKYSTSAEAILEENEIEGQGGRRILIIPMKN